MSLETLESLYAIAQFVGVIVLAITFLVGAFTVYLGWKVNKAQKAEIRKKDEQLARDLKDKEIQIAAAKLEAAKANETAKNSEQQNIKLRSDLTTMQIDMANARRKQAEAERALEELRARLRSRSLTLQQQTIIAKELQSAKGSNITVIQLLDAESSSYAKQIMETISNAGWTVKVIRIGIMASPAYGLICSVVDPNNPPLPARVLVTAFQKADIQITLESKIGPPATTDTVLVVGLKPPAL